jgi:hypothetical protein
MKKFQLATFRLVAQCLIAPLRGPIGKEIQVAKAELSATSL